MARCMSRGTGSEVTAHAAANLLLLLSDQRHVAQLIARSVISILC